MPIYLRDAGIGALLDAPIYLNGEVVGLFCCAHIGSTRAWTDAEQYIAGSFSDYSQLVLMAHQHHHSVEVVRAQRTRMQQGQPLEIMGAMADMTVDRCKSLFTTISSNVQQMMHDCADSLSSDAHAHMLTVMSSCEKGNQLVAQVQEFSPTAHAPSSDGTTTRCLEAAHGVAQIIRGLASRQITVDVEIARDGGSVACNRQALTRALFSMAYQGLGQTTDGGRVKITAQICKVNGRNRDVFEFVVTNSSVVPRLEVEAGLVMATSFAAAVGATLSIEHVPGGTRTSLRIPMADTAPHQRPREGSAIVIVADVEEPPELVDMLRFFKHNPVVLSTQDCLGYLRDKQSSVKLVVLDASNSDVPVLERLRPLLLATTSLPVLVIGTPEACAGLPTDVVRLKVMPGASLAEIAAQIEQSLQRTVRS